METVPPPDLAAEPDGYVVQVDSGDRIHFLDWGGPPGGAGVLLIHGLSNTAWSWAPVARRLRGVRRVVALDLRGHGLSDAPTSGYDPDTLAGDVRAVAEGSGLLSETSDQLVLAGHGFGAIVAAWTAAALGTRCAGVVLVDGGWESLDAASGMDVDEFLRGLEEPPEVMRSMGAFLADRRAFDSGSWDADQERAARATVVETHAGRVVPSTRPHVTEACVRAMFDYQPARALSAFTAPITALIADADDSSSSSRRAALDTASAARVEAQLVPIRVRSFGPTGHNLMRYRPDQVCETLMSIAAAQTTPTR